MAAPNAVASAENWRRRVHPPGPSYHFESRRSYHVLKEQFAAATHSRFGVQEDTLPVAHNTIGVPNVRPGSKKMHPRSAGRAHQSSMQGSGLIQEACEGHYLPKGRGCASGHQHGTQQRRSITGSVNGFAGSAASYRQAGASQASSRRSSAQPAPPASSGSWASDATPPFREFSVPSRLYTPAGSECSYPQTPNFSSAGSACTAEVLSKLEKLEQQLAIEQVRREKAEREMAQLKQQGLP